MSNKAWKCTAFFCSLYDWAEFNSTRRFYRYLEDVDVERIPEKSCDILETALPKEWIELLDSPEMLRKIRKLPADYIEIIEMLCFENLTQREIAERMSCSQQNIAKKIEKIKKVLKWGCKSGLREAYRVKERKMLLLPPTEVIIWSRCRCRLIENRITPADNEPCVRAGPNVRHDFDRAICWRSDGRVYLLTTSVKLDSPQLAITT